MSYPPQYPQAPVPQPQFVPPTYPPQQPPQYYPQVPPQAPPAPQGPPPAAGSLDAYFQQPSTGGGKAVTLAVGQSITGRIARPITDADVQQQTNRNGQPQFYKDGRPKFVMVVPLEVAPSQEHPEGRATWWIRGQGRDELTRAMAEAGAPQGPPEAGAVVTITCTGERPIPGFSPQKQYAIKYQRPPGAPPVPAPDQQPVSVPPPPDPSTPIANSIPQQPQMPAPQAYVPAQPTGSTVNVPAAGNMTPEQQQLLAQLAQQPPS